MGRAPWLRLGAARRHPRGHFCAERVSLTEPDLAAAVFTPPWPASTPRPESHPPEAQPEPTPPWGHEGFEKGRDSGEPPSTFAPLGVVTEERATVQCHGRGELRQQTAARLIDVDDPVIRSARFTIYASYT